MKSTKSNLPIGSFKSTPIMANTRADARELLARTYTPDRFELRPIGDKVKMHAGGYNAGWFFMVCPLPAPEKLTSTSAVAAVEPVRSELVDVPSVLECAADALDGFGCENADYYRAEFAKIERNQAALENILEKAFFTKKKADDSSFNINSLRDDARAAIEAARGQ